MSLTFDQLRQVVLDRDAEDFAAALTERLAPGDCVADVAAALGEAACLIMELQRGGRVPEVTIAQELGDVVVQLARLAARLDVDLGQAARDGFNLIGEELGSAIRL